MTTAALVSLRIYVHGKEMPGLHVTIAKVKLSLPVDQWNLLDALVKDYKKYFGRNVVYSVKDVPVKWGPNSFFIDFHNDTIASVDTIRKQMISDLAQMPNVELDKERYRDGIPPQHIATRGVFPTFTTGVTFAIVVKAMGR